MTGMSLKQRALGAVQGSPLLTSLAFAADNLLAAANISQADPAPDEHLGGADVEADLAYARSVADAYLRDGPIRGRVAEVGPGGSAAVALLLLAQGCDSVDLIDRFRFSHDPGRLAALYDRIIESSPALRERFGSSRDLAPHINFHTGEQAAAELFFRDHQGYDAILSCAVLEHLYDPLAALAAMASALVPGGRLLHQVDLRDHGMFTAGGHHELTFLGIPAWFYPHMTRRRGRPNRVLAHRYRAALDQLGLDYQLLATHLVGVGPIPPAPYDQVPAELRGAAESRVEQYRARLAPEFRSLPASDLAISSIFIAARWAA